MKKRFFLAAPFMLAAQEQDIILITEPAAEYTPPSAESHPDFNVIDMSAVEEKPLFPEPGVQDFIAKNLQYSQECAEMGIAGRVVVEFVVKEDGTVTDASIKRGVHTLLDREALRLVKSMPKWIPGKQAGQAVAVRYRLPVTFHLK